MKRKIKKLFDAILKPFDLRLRHISYESDLQLDKDFSNVLNKVRPYTMTSPESMFALYQSVQHIVKNNIEGDIVECGVWRGGSSMVNAITLLKHNDYNRILHLYDTYEGMSTPTENDISFKGEKAENTWTNIHACEASIEDVKQNLSSTGYPFEKINFIKGKVEDTIPNNLPDKIAILRLDTDWYESTYHELVHLYPKLVKGGILIVDDYGFWAGAKKAVDQYFSENNIPIFLNRVDYTVRIAIKV